MASRSKLQHKYKSLISSRPFVSTAPYNTSASPQNSVKYSDSGTTAGGSFHNLSAHGGSSSRTSCQAVRIEEFCRHYANTRYY